MEMVKRVKPKRSPFRLYSFARLDRLQESLNSDGEQTLIVGAAIVLHVEHAIGRAGLVGHDNTSHLIDQQR